MATLVNFKRKSAFIHIPKCAGTTISLALIRDNRTDWVAGSRLPNISEAIVKSGTSTGSDLVYTDHARYKDLQNVLGTAVFDEYEVFTAVRCPWERLESTYHFIRREPDNTLSDLMRAMTFNDFIIYHCTVARALQTDWLSNQDGEIKIHHIFRNDEIDTKGESFMRQRFGVSLPEDHLNTSDNAFGKKYETYKWASDYAVEMFAEIYKNDFVNFGYDPTPPMRGETWFLGADRVREIAAISVKKIHQTQGMIDLEGPDFPKYMLHFATLSGENLHRILIDKHEETVRLLREKIATLESRSTSA